MGEEGHGIECGKNRKLMVKSMTHGLERYVEILVRKVSYH